ncbi:oxidoreductase family protein [Pseudomaricurvus sp. HS19]|uniref:oxidoreductase family protein n=1 Tax=Pseudomaricurvus sp. HS19 TaxID=2692626 RepID=UPI00136B37D2|nr:oxidoreductase family protein [Pseudomaricurvus sp. HS19]MYM63106.1 DUF1679 domain-containing protein [Pseudomaricurvus sp. HS19]
MLSPTQLIAQTFALDSTQVSAPLPLQTLWSGYGQIERYHLHSSDPKVPDSLIAKRIEPPTRRSHPRGWNSNLGHQRKLHSYEVESHWYGEWSKELPDSPRTAHCYARHTVDNSHLLLLEDLDAAGYPQRRQQLAASECEPCLHWLAQLHGHFLQYRPASGWQKQLWSSGTYWHLQTRPDEWQQMAEGPLKQLAPAIDQELNSSDYTTLVHGDAKVANFCFSADGSRVAAVDFQYIGAGCGMKDVAYFMGSCLSEDACESQWENLLDSYFSALHAVIRKRQLPFPTGDLELQWRNLFPMAWADFERFLMGWEPEHHKLTHFSRQMTRTALATLQHKGI